MSKRAYSRSFPSVVPGVRTHRTHHLIVSSSHRPIIAPSSSCRRITHRTIIISVSHHRMYHPIVSSSPQGRARVVSSSLVASRSHRHIIIPSSSRRFVSRRLIVSSSLHLIIFSSLHLILSSPLHRIVSHTTPTIARDFFSLVQQFITIADAVSGDVSSVFLANEWIEVR